MKIDFVKLFLSVLTSALICFALDTFFSSDFRAVYTAVSFSLMSVMLCFTFGVKYDLPRTGTNMRLVSGMSFLVLFITNTLMYWQRAELSVFIILNGFLVIVSMFILNSIYRSKQ